MPTYAYQAVDGAGKRLAGHTVAASAGAAARTLEARGLLLLDLDQAADGEGSGGPWFRLGRRREILEVTRAMAALLPVGMPLTQALAASTNVATGDVRAAVDAIRGRVERGVVKVGEPVEIIGMMEEGKLTSTVTGVTSGRHAVVPAVVGAVVDVKVGPIVTSAKS